MCFDFEDSADNLSNGLSISEACRDCLAFSPVVDS